VTQIKKDIVRPGNLVSPLIADGCRRADRQEVWKDLADMAETLQTGEEKAWRSLPEEFKGYSEYLGWLGGKDSLVSRQACEDYLKRKNRRVSFSLPGHKKET